MERLIPSIAGHVEFIHAHRWDAGLKLSRVGTWKGLRRFQELTPEDARIRFAGDYFGLPSTNSSLASGETAAKHLTRGLRGLPARK